MAAVFSGHVGSKLWTASSIIILKREIRQKNFNKKMNRLKSRDYLQVYGILEGGYKWKYCAQLMIIK